MKEKQASIQRHEVVDTSLTDGRGREAAVVRGGEKGDQGLLTTD